MDKLGGIWKETVEALHELGRLTKYFRGQTD
jgi:hypothetical protein